MTIKLYNDRIEFINGANTFILTEDMDVGAKFTGKISALELRQYAGTFQGDSHGYTASGWLPTATFYNTIDRFPFASTTTNAADVGDLTRVVYAVSGQSSQTHGYTSGGISPPALGPPSNVIDKFPFSITTNATDVGDLTVIRAFTGGHSSSTHGYASGGRNPLLSPGTSNVIDRFPFAVDQNSADVGDLTSGTGKYGGAGISSASDGYHAGGFISPTIAIGISKFPFATNANSFEVGEVSFLRRYTVGQSSSTHGYNAGGWISSPVSVPQNAIDKFPFASGGIATDVGDLTVSRYGPAGQSSTTHGYTSGGYVPPSGNGSSNVIDRFPFTTNANATDVGDLTQRRYLPGGTQD